MSTEDRMQLAAINIRGRILEYSVQMENQMDIYIADSYAKDANHSNDMIFMILGSRVTFKSKYEILEYLLIHQEPKVNSKNKKEIQKIKHLIELRNCFSHWPVEYSQPSMQKFEKKDIITFVRIRGNNNGAITRKEYRENDINSIIDDFMKSIEILRNLNNIV